MFLWPSLLQANVHIGWCVDVEIFTFHKISREKSSLTNTSFEIGTNVTWKLDIWNFLPSNTSEKSSQVWKTCCWSKMSPMCKIPTLASLCLMIDLHPEVSTSHCITLGTQRNICCRSSKLPRVLEIKFDLIEFHEWHISIRTSEVLIGKVKHLFNTQEKSWVPHRLLRHLLKFLLQNQL